MSATASWMRNPARQCTTIEDDHEAWSSSIEHIRATPGFPDGRWPRAMTLEENHADLERHARDFAARCGFTYTVLDPSDRSVIGCVYIYPDNKSVVDAIAPCTRKVGQDPVGKRK